MVDIAVHDARVNTTDVSYDIRNSVTSLDLLPLEHITESETYM